MSTPLQERMDAALAQLRAQHEKIRQFGTGMAAQTTALTSKNRMVAATVDSRGRLTELSFKGSRWRNLPPAELAALIVETVASAQETASREVVKAAAELLPAGFGLAGLTGGDLDLDGMFEAALRLAEQPVFAGKEGDESGTQVRDV